MALIEVKNLSFTYTEGRKPAARNLDFEIEAGEMYRRPSPTESTAMAVCIDAFSVSGKFSMKYRVPVIPKR